jgi:hypothetical protein
MCIYSWMNRRGAKYTDISQRKIFVNDIDPSRFAMSNFQLGASSEVAATLWFI